MTEVDGGGDDWMGFTAACSFARGALGVAEEEPIDAATSALMARARDGLIATTAKRSERIFEPLGQSPEYRAFDKSDGAIFIELLYAILHMPGECGGDQWSALYVNRAAGDFKFEIESDNEPRFRLTYSVWGLAFKRDDVEASFPSITPDAIVGSSDASRPRSRNRYAIADAPLVEEMHRLVESGEATSLWHAALIVAPGAAGNASIDTKRERIYDKRRR